MSWPADLILSQTALLGKVGVKVVRWETESTLTPDAHKHQDPFSDMTDRYPRQKGFFIDEGGELLPLRRGVVGVFWSP